MAKIYIVEDEETIRKELSLLLKNTGYEIAETKNFRDVTEQILEAAPDLVLLDVSLPGESGLQICAKLRQVSQIPIIFVTANNTSMDELNCIMQGGDDYIAKPYQTPILLARIGAVLKRSLPEVSTAENETGQLVCSGVILDMASATVSYNGKKAELTKNEWKILCYLFKHQGKIVSRSELIDYLWDNEVFIDDNTLSVNMTRIRSRLTGIGVDELIVTKRGLGYKCEK